MRRTLEAHVQHMDALGNEKSATILKKKRNESESSRFFS